MNLCKINIFIIIITTFIIIIIITASKSNLISLLVISFYEKSPLENYRYAQSSDALKYY